MSGIIYIFGPSCSGKSTLAKALEKRLGHLWTYIDRDELIEKGHCIESKADKVLEEKILAIKNRVIVDAQVPWREKKMGELYCLLLPPLKKLLERDAQRSACLKRSELRAHYAKEYVVNTYNILSAMDPSKFDICIDSSLFSVEETVLKIYRKTSFLLSSYTRIIGFWLTFKQIFGVA